MDTLASKQEAVDNCYFIKTILMLLVVLYHSIVFCGNWFHVKEVIYPSQPLAVLAQWLNSFHVYGFTLVSGYLFFT